MRFVSARLLTPKKLISNSNCLDSRKKKNIWSWSEYHTNFVTRVGKGPDWVAPHHKISVTFRSTPYTFLILAIETIALWCHVKHFHCVCISCGYEHILKNKMSKENHLYKFAFVLCHYVPYIQAYNVTKSVKTQLVIGPHSWNPWNSLNLE